MADLGRYDNLDDGLANEESDERGASARTNAMHLETHAFPYACASRHIAAQANTTDGRAEVDKATGGEVNEDGLAMSGGNVLRYGRNGLEVGGNGCWYIAVDTLSTLGSLFSSIPPYLVFKDSGT